jgi:hypothetical protein
MALGTGRVQGIPITRVEFESLGLNDPTQIEGKIQGH